MSEPIYTGTNAARRLKDGLMFDPRTGWTITRRWKGPEVAIRAIGNTEGLLGNRFVITPSEDGGDFLIESTFADIENQPEDKPLSDIWELDSNTLEKELWELPWMIEQFQSIKDNAQGNPTGDPRLVAAACINWIRKAIEAWISGQDKITTLDPDERPLTYAELRQDCIAYGLHSDAFDRIVFLYAHGIKSFPICQFVLKRTRVIANNFNRNNLANIYSDVFKRRTTESLESAEAIPNTIRFILPEGEWVKQPITIKQTSATKWTVEEEWWHGDHAFQEIYGDLI